MTDRELDHILAEQPEIQPSDSFTAVVMQAVRREAATPPPIRFPLFCIAPLLLAWGVFLLAVLTVPFYAVPAAGAPPSTWSFDLATLRYAFTSAAAWLQQFQAGWILTALALTLASIGLPLRLIRRRF
jgi:hypothetical protein